MDEMRVSFCARRVITCIKRRFVVAVLATKGVALTALYCCGMGIARLPSWEISENKEEKMTSAFHAHMRNALLAPCMCPYMRHLAINYQRFQRETGKAGRLGGFGGCVFFLETDCIRPTASHD